MLYSQHINYCFTRNNSKDGIPKDVFENILFNAELFTKSISNSFDQNTLPLLNIIKNNNDLSIINDISDYVIDNFDKIIIIAMDDQSINGKVFAKFASYNKPKIKIEFIDNIDPQIFDILLSNIDYQKTAFLVISRTGKNIKTTSATLTLIDFIKKNYNKYYKFYKHFFFITENHSNPIRLLASSLKSPIIDYPPLSTQFSTLTIVGLLIATILGLSPLELRLGAIETIEKHLDEVAIGASLSTGLLGYGYNVQGLITFQESLSGFNDWYSNITSKSLAKENKGFTPITVNASSAGDSMMQFFMEGPKDKFLTFVSYNSENEGYKIECSDKFSFLQNKHLGSVNHQIQKNFISNIIKKSIPSRILKIYNLDSYTLGGLFMHFTLESIVTAKLLKVNPFTYSYSSEQNNYLKKILQDS